MTHSDRGAIGTHILLRTCLAWYWTDANGVASGHVARREHGRGGPDLWLNGTILAALVYFGLDKPPVPR